MKKYPEDEQKRKHRIPKLFFGIVVILITGCILAYGALVVFKHTEDHTIIIATASAVIALIALLYTYLTYSSIDSVNKLSRMDGNVLENKDYLTEFSVIVLRYREYTNEEILKHVIHTFKKPLKDHNMSGAKLSDSLQEIIDVMRPLAFMLNNTKPEYGETLEQELSKLVKKIEKRVDGFYDISDGSTKLMKETVKLIKGVLYYQKYRSNEKADKTVELLKVNCSILRNKSSRSLYHNYRGLIYYNGAIDIIKKSLYPEQKTHDLFEIRIMREIPDKVKRELKKDYDMVMMSLEEAIKHHRKALDLVGDDPLGNAYIQYDLARALFLINHLRASQNTEWRDTMDKAIFYRARLYMTAKDLTKAKNIEENIQEKAGEQKETYIVNGYLFQWMKALEMKALLEITLDMPVTDSYGRVIADSPKYKKELTTTLGLTDVPGFKSNRKFKEFIDKYLSEINKDTSK